MSANLSSKIVDPRQVEGWNDFVDNHPHGWVSHRSEWFDLIAHVSPAIEPRYIVVERALGGDIQAVLPLCLVRSPIGRRQLVSLPYATLCDPLALSPGAMQFLALQLPAVMRQEAACDVEMRTFRAAEIGLSPQLSRKDDHVHHEIDLAHSEAELLASFDGGCVRNRIRKAQKGALKVRMAETIAELRTFYALYVGSRQRLGLPAQPWLYFEGLWQHIRPAGLMELLLVLHGGRIVAGLLVLHNRMRASAEVLVYDDQSKAHCPNHLAFWTAICRAKAAGRRKFDFGRTPMTEEELIAFKGRWGTVSRPLPIFRHPPVHYQGPPKQGRLYAAARNALRNAPVPVFEAFSSLFYRWRS